jgi:hypothetical protein
MRGARLVVALFRGSTVAIAAAAPPAVKLIGTRTRESPGGPIPVNC